MKKFAIIGVGGYIATRHLKAIKEVEGQLVAACDEKDSVGQLDSHSYDVQFFLKENDFFNYVKKNHVDIVIVCSPNYLHASHIEQGLRAGADVVCEKPLALTEAELNRLEAVEKETGKKIGTILQLRIHPSLVKIQREIASARKRDHLVDLTYITSRGPWYHASWKGDVKKSGGLATNIGVHFFDMLYWFFGAPKDILVTESSDMKMAGSMAFESAKVSWLLSVNHHDLPAQAKESKKTTFRSITVDGNEIEFSDGFNDLHTELYKKFLSGEIFGVSDVRPGIAMVEEIRLQAERLK
jgi:UDP-N-acetyl-2-amino-2-deoxyglucuronate dehydrogenase